MGNLLDSITTGRQPQPPRIMIYGSEGVGKSTFAASAPKPVFVQTEDGLSEIDTATFPLCATYADVVEQLKAVRDGEHDFQTLCIDSLDWFESDARRFGYPAQAAFYREVLRTASDGEVVADCFLIAVEKREPFRCGVWKLTDGILEACAVENERAIAELTECRRTNIWPTKTEDLRILDV